MRRRELRIDGRWGNMGQYFGQFVGFLYRHEGAIIDFVD